MVLGWQFVSLSEHHRGLRVVLWPQGGRLSWAVSPGKVGRVPWDSSSACFGASIVVCRGLDWPRCPTGTKAHFF